MDPNYEPCGLEHLWEAGAVEMDSPPGISERLYEKWKAAGGQVKKQTQPEMWAIVELMGHVRLAGRLTEEEKFGSKMGRLDIPQDDDFVTQFFGGGSVYRITVVTEAVARQAAKQTTVAPIHPWDYPKQLTQKELRDDYEEEQDHY
jgi:hypothetical protein